MLKRQKTKMKMMSMLNTLKSVMLQLVLERMQKLWILLFRMRSWHRMHNKNFKFNHLMSNLFKDRQMKPFRYRKTILMKQIKNKITIKSQKAKMFQMPIESLSTLINVISSTRGSKEQPFIRNTLRLRRIRQRTRRTLRISRTGMIQMKKH